jgi:hypothetical protein
MAKAKRTRKSSGFGYLLSRALVGAVSHVLAEQIAITRALSSLSVPRGTRKNTQVTRDLSPEEYEIIEPKRLENKRIKK